MPEPQGSVHALALASLQSVPLTRSVIAMHAVSCRGHHVCNVSFLCFQAGMLHIIIAASHDAPLDVATSGASQCGHASRQQHMYLRLRLLVNPCLCPQSCYNCRWRPLLATSGVPTAHSALPMWLLRLHAKSSYQQESIQHAALFLKRTKLHSCPSLLIL